MVPFQRVILRGGDHDRRWEYNQQTRVYKMLFATTYLEWWTPRDGSGIWRKVRWTLRIGELQLVRGNGIEKVMEVWDWDWADDEEMPDRSTAATASTSPAPSAASHTRVGN